MPPAWETIKKRSRKAKNQQSDADDSDDAPLAKKAKVAQNLKIGKPRGICSPHLPDGQSKRKLNVFIDSKARQYRSQKTLEPMPSSDGSDSAPPKRFAKANKQKGQLSNEVTLNTEPLFH